jgi:hypothetical protein
MTQIWNQGLLLNYPAQKNICKTGWLNLTKLGTGL